MKTSHPLSKCIQEKTWVEISEFYPPRATSFKQVDSPAAENMCLAVVDNPGAEPAISALAACAHLIHNKHHPILNINCRDTNRIAIQSTVLGALSMGIGAFFVEAGLHQSLGSMKDAKNVYDIDPVQTLNILVDLRDNHRLSNGVSIDGDAEFLVGIRVHPGKGDPELKPYLLKKKMACGADFIITGPITDFDKLEAWRESVSELDGMDVLPVFVGIPASVSQLPDSVRNSRFYRGVYRYAC